MPPKVLKQWVPFGDEVRRRRVEMGMSQTNLGKKARVSGAMIGHIERAVRAPTRAQVDRFDEVFTTNGAMLRLWSSTLSNRNVPEWFQNALATEERAQQVLQYQPILVPGLLQTERYARVLIRAWQPRAPETEVDQLVYTRTRRLPALLARRPTLWFVVDEVVVRRPVGPEDVLAEQLDHIADLAEQDSIRFQVIPQRPLHPGICPPFRMMVVGEETVVFVEHALGDVARSDHEDVAQMRTLFGAMQADALAPSDSVEHIREIRKEIS